jgi:adenine/guanine phosphoribosyltransferase-like PRPP-binding protein
MPFSSSNTEILVTQKSKTTNRMPLIIGVAVGGAVLAAIIVLALVIVIARRRKKTPTKTEERSQSFGLR